MPKNQTKKEPIRNTVFLILAELIFATGIGLAIAASCGLLPLQGKANDTPVAEANSSKELPTLSISLKDINLTTFMAGKKDDKYKGNTVEFTDGTSATYENVEIKGRGNSTWGQPKPPFQLKFSESVDFLDLGASKKWVFLANFYDDSNLRNDIAFKIADIVNEKYANSGEFVKVFIDNEYLGIYYMTHKLEVGKGSVNLRDNYGVLVEIDNLHRDTEECFVSKYNTCVTIKDTVADDEKEADIVKAAMDSFMESYNRFEEAVRTRNYESVSQIIDVESFIKYYLISELTNNPDAYDSSYYLYKDGTDDKIHAGPVWDFDLALGNRTWMYGDNPRAYSPYLFVSQSNAMQKATNTLEFFELLEIPEFQNKVKAFFKEHLLDKETELINYVKTRAQSIQDEAERDADKWGFSSPNDEVDYLIDWLKRKIEVVNYNLNR